MLILFARLLADWKCNKWNESDNMNGKANDFHDINIDLNIHMLW